MLAPPPVIPIICVFVPKIKQSPRPDTHFLDFAHLAEARSLFRPSVPLLSTCSKVYMPDASLFSIHVASAPIFCFT